MQIWEQISAADMRSGISGDRADRRPYMMLEGASKSEDWCCGEASPHRRCNQIEREVATQIWGLQI